jgi:hypothetical protein
MVAGRIGRHVVLQRHGDIDQSSGHRHFPVILNQTGLVPALATTPARRCAFFLFGRFKALSALHVPPG